jgi:AcrR family transcriptional regulator
MNEEVRHAVLVCAEQAFAERGYAGTTMAHIAERAGVSTGNIYRYFADKETLFAAVLPDAFARSFRRILRQRVNALIRAQDLQHLDAEAAARGEALLSFWIAHRLKVVTILDRAAGSRHAGFADAFMAELMKPSLLKLEREAGRPVPDAARFLLEQVFRNTVRSIVAILERYSAEDDIRRAFAGFWSFQLAGLAGFTRWVTE